MEKLIIRLGEHEQDPIHWLVYAAAVDDVIASGELQNQQALSTLTEHALTREVIALVPASAVLLKWVHLPQKVNSKILAAIPYMLEEELTQDISTQFFALGPRRGTRQGVAIVAKKTMQQWRQALDDANLHVKRMLPDVLCIPYEPDKVSLVAFADLWLLRQDEWQGLQGENLWLHPALEQLAEHQETPLTVVNYSQIALDDLKTVSVEQATLELPLLLMARQLASQSFNLLQGEFKVKRKRTGQLAQWRVPAVLLVLVLLSALINNAVSLFQLSSQNTDLAQQIDASVKQHFPNLGAYRDLRRRLETELQSLQQTGGGAPSLLNTLALLGDAFKTAGVRPQSLRFDGQRNELRMQVEGANFEALERFKKLSEQAGFTVEQGAINNRDNRVVGSLALRRTA